MTLHIPLGRVVHDTDGVEWVFIGWSITTIGETAEFVRAVSGRRHGVQPWFYTASKADTLLRKFPDLVRTRVPSVCTACGKRHRGRTRRCELTY